MALRNADRPPALTSDPFHVGPALTEVMGRLAAQPDKMMRAQADLFTRYMDLWQSTARRLHDGTSEPVATPAKGDKRFNDPEWSDNPAFDRLYLTQNPPYVDVWFRQDELQAALSR